MPRQAKRLVRGGGVDPVAADVEEANLLGGLADFLFVIDNSGSMGNEQEALSQAAAEQLLDPSRYIAAVLGEAP